MVPSAPTGLADLLPAALDAVLDLPNALSLPRRTGVVVLLVDGLGADSLSARSGHARALTGSGRVRRITTGGPTTTAAALTTLTTGRSAGQHGVVGYSALEPASGRVVNQLHGFDGELPSGWQRSATVFERAADVSVGAVAVGPRHLAATGFTREVLRGARYTGARTIADRLEAAVAALREGPSVVYCYVPELDATAHREGCGSGAWTVLLETVDAAVAEAAAALGPGETLLVTADHGMVDVGEADHLLLDDHPGLLDGVAHVAGEPRLLHLHLDDGADATEAAERWGAVLGRRVDVRTRAQAVDGGWFGAVDAEVAPRIGDVLVAARGRTALYEDREAVGRRMVGQHGSWTAAERLVPLLRFDG